MPIAEPETRHGLTIGLPVIIRHENVEQAVSERSPIGSVVLVNSIGTTHRRDGVTNFTYYGPNPRNGQMSYYQGRLQDVEIMPQPAPTPEVNRRDRRNLRAKLEAKLAQYRTVENPPLAVKVIVEELEGMLAL